MPLYNNSMMRGALGITRSGDLRTGRTYSVSGFGADAPPCAPCDAARRAAADRAMGAPPVFYDTDTNMTLSGYGRFSGFGEVKDNAAAPLSSFYGRTDDKWDIWMNEAARTWARVTGNTEEAIMYRNRGVQLNGAFGKTWLKSCSTFATPLPDDPTNCNDVPLVGLACRGLPANFHPCESVVRGGIVGAVSTGAQQVTEQAQQTYTSVTGGGYPSASASAVISGQYDPAALAAVASMGLTPAVRDSLRASAAGKLFALRARTATTSEDTLGTEGSGEEEKKGGMNTALIVGGVAAVVAAVFLLKK